MEMPEKSSFDLENLLKKLPLHQMRKQKELVFYAKLMKLSREKKQEERAEVLSTATSLFDRLTLRFAPLRVFAAATLSVLVLFVGVSAASLSPKITRGNFLYPVKQFEERAELAFADTPLDRVKTHMKFADRRLSELEVLFSGNPELLRIVSVAFAHEDIDGGDQGLDPNIHATIDDYYDSTSKATEEIPNIEETEKVSEALATVETAQEKHVKRLEKLYPQAAGVAKPVLVETIAAVEEHQAEIIEKKVEVLRRKEAGERKTVFKPTSMKKVVEEIRKRELAGEKFVEKFEKREEEAKRQFAEAKERFEMLQKEVLNERASADPEKKFEFFVDEKLEEAERALAEGNYGKVFGLSRAAEGMTTKFRLFEEGRKLREQQSLKLRKKEPKIFVSEPKKEEERRTATDEKLDDEKPEAAAVVSPVVGETSTVEETEDKTPEADVTIESKPAEKVFQEFEKFLEQREEKSEFPEAIEASQKEELLNLIEKRMRELKIVPPQTPDYREKSMEELQVMLQSLEKKIQQSSGVSEVNGSGPGIRPIEKTVD